MPNIRPIKKKSTLNKIINNPAINQTKNAFNHLSLNASLYIQINMKNAIIAPNTLKKFWIAATTIPAIKFTKTVLTSEVFPPKNFTLYI